MHPLHDDEVALRARALREDWAIWIKLVRVPTMRTNGNVEKITEKIQMLSPEQIAEVEDFVDFLRLRAQDRGLIRASAELSTPAFAAIWNNPEDDVYDAL